MMVELGELGELYVWYLVFDMLVVDFGVVVDEFGFGFVVLWFVDVFEWVYYVIVYEVFVWLFVGEMFDLMFDEFVWCVFYFELFGVDCLWFMLILESYMIYGYYVIDYFDIVLDFGLCEDFEVFVE